MTTANLLDAFVDGFHEQASDVSEPTEDGERQDEPDPRFPFVCTRVFGHHWARESREVPKTEMSVLFASSPIVHSRTLPAHARDKQ